MYGLARALLFRLDPERAHELATAQMRRAQKSPTALRFVRQTYAAPEVPRTVWGLHFANPLGIAAGFDKNGEFIPFLAALGFGFVEVGTVTLEAQPGNPKPRMFRFPGQQALINRLGFNNEGASAVASRLSIAVRDAQLAAVPLFVNIGKNRDVPSDAATKNYADCFRIVAPFSDAIVVNVSSPNTAGLRDLQKPESLVGIIEALRDVAASTTFVRPGQHPIIVKIAPDLEDSQLIEIADAAGRHADGMTATNTTIDKSSVGSSEAGGLSGKPLFRRSTDVLRRLRQLLPAEFPLIGVGGIFTASDAREKLAAGADLVQAYTGFIYEGPGFAQNIVRGL